MGSGEGLGEGLSFTKIVVRRAGGAEEELHSNWSGGAAFPDGRVVMSPDDHPSVLLLNASHRSWEMIGSFEGGDKWSGCATLPDGRAVFAPSSHPSILLLDPIGKSWEMLGSFDGEDKWSGCAVLQDGRVVFAPHSHPSLLLLDPVSKVFELIGSFEQEGKWQGCAVLPDGRVVCAPYHHDSILLFDPVSKAFELIGSFDGEAKWAGCAVLPDGRVVCAPCGHPSMLVFDPTSELCQMVGQFSSEEDKWRSCVVLPDGSVCCAPYDETSMLLVNANTKKWERVGRFSKTPCKWSAFVAVQGAVIGVPSGCLDILVIEHEAFHRVTQKRKRQDAALETTTRMWSKRAFTDAVVVAGVAPGQKSFQVHRAVLASRSDVFARLFSGDFCEAKDARVEFAEEPAVVEAVLEHTYTGDLPKGIDSLQALVLAHRLGLSHCVAACAADLGRCRSSEAVRVLAPLRGDPDIEAAWAQLKCRLCRDTALLDTTLLELAGLGTERDA